MKRTLPIPSRERRTELSLALVRLGFFATLLLFPFGKSFRVIGSIVCLISVAAYYSHDYKHSTLAQFPRRWVFALFGIFLIANTAFSRWPALSFAFIEPTVLESWPLLFAGIESIRSKQDLKRLGVFCLAAVCVEGLAGVWQYVTGFDPIKGDPLMSGRLTGSLGTYRVGNYVGITILPALAGYFALPESWSRTARRLMLAALLVPPIFLLVGSQTRAGMLGLAAGVYLLCALRFRRQWLVLLGLPLVLLLIILFGPERISLAQAMHDGRWELWACAWNIFLDSPLFGSGASTFNPALQAIGCTLSINTLNIPHPHCIYLQFLADGGIVGFSIAMALLLGTWWWSAIRVWRGTDTAARKVSREQWITACIWAGYSSYLTTGLFGHNFYRTWWLGLGMALLGATIGACMLTARLGENAEGNKA